LFSEVVVVVVVVEVDPEHYRAAFLDPFQAASYPVVAFL